MGTDGGGSGRQAGSTFKPIVLAEAMSQGVSLQDTLPGPAKIVLKEPTTNEDWEVNNYESASYGRISLLKATADSVNTVYAQLVVSLGPQKVVDMAKRMGVKSPLNPNASIALGTGDVSVLDMASVYQTIQSKGMQIEPRVIRKITQNNSVLVDDRPKSTRVMDRSVADKVHYALQQVVDQGSGTAAALPQAQVWGKTGTTDNDGDAWFVGYTRHLTTAVWMGYPEGQARPLYDVQGVRKVNGGSLPASIFKRFMAKASPNDDTPPERAPDLSGKSLAPVSSVASSGSSTANGSSSAATTTTAPGREETETPTTTVAPRTQATLPEQTTVPTTPAPVVTAPATTATTTPRPRVTVTWPTDITRP